MNTCEASPKPKVECDAFTANILNKLQSSLNVEKSVPPQKQVLPKLLNFVDLNPCKASNTSTSSSKNDNPVIQPKLDTLAKTREYVQQRKSSTNTPSEPIIFPTGLLPAPQLVSSTVSFDPYEFALKNGLL